MAADDDDEPTLQSGVGRSARPRTLTGGKATSIAPGQLLGHTYRIEALLARGGMGEVYRARHAELDTEHAIKIILPELADDTVIVDLFRREASNLRTIRHDAIVAYEGVFRDENGRLYLVMEFVDGPSLSKVLKQAPLPPAQVRQLRDRIADGLAAAHEKNVIHRDLSPDNVILPAGDVGKAKIIDFGIAKLTDASAKTIVGTSFAGKFSYVSPEQVGMFGGKVDGRSDIYSLGLVLAAAAIGKPLDMGNSLSSVNDARRTVPDLSRVPKELRDELAAMLQPDPADRPQSMRELLRGPSRPAPRTDPGRSRRPIGDVKIKPSPSPTRSPVAAIAAIALVLVLAIGGIGYWLFVPPDTDQREKIAALTNGANQAIQGFACARLAVQVSPAADIQVAGYVASEADKEQIAARLSALANVGRVENALVVMKRPICEVLEVVHAETAFGAATAPQIDPGGAGGVYRRHENLKLTVTAMTDGYLYVDYVDAENDPGYVPKDPNESDRYVLHLLPNSNWRPEQRWVTAGEKVVIGTLPDELKNYVIEEPFGTYVIIAISSPEPLFDPARFVEEQAAVYLPELRTRLAEVGQRVGRENLPASSTIIVFQEQ